MPATISLLGRAVALLPVGDERRHELMCELGIAYMSAGDMDACNAQFNQRRRVLRRSTSAASSCERRLKLRTDFC